VPHVPAVNAESRIESTGATGEQQRVTPYDLWTLPNLNYNIEFSARTNVFRRPRKMPWLAGDHDACNCDAALGRLVFAARSFGCLGRFGWLSRCGGRESAPVTATTPVLQVEPASSLTLAEQRAIRQVLAERIRIEGKQGKVFWSASSWARFAAQVRYAGPAHLLGAETEGCDETGGRDWC